MQKNAKLNLSLVFVSLVAVALISAGLRPDAPTQETVPTQARSTTSNDGLTVALAPVLLTVHEPFWAAAAIEDGRVPLVSAGGAKVGLDGYSVDAGDVKVDVKTEALDFDITSSGVQPNLGTSASIEIGDAPIKVSTNPLRPRLKVGGFGF